jgi:parvulin-like peptidyl-prolyl isomerase
MRKWLLITLVLAAIHARAEIIDRMLAVVNGHIVLMSDVKRERQLRRVLNEATPAEDKKLVQELVDRHVIEDQIALFPGIEITDQAVQEEIGRRNLSANVSETVRDAIRLRLRTADFFNERFRQFIQAGDDEIREYYENQFVPEARRRGAQTIPPLSEVSDLIRKNVIEEKLMRDVDNWLDASRRRSEIEIFE